MAKLTAAERAAHEEGNLHMLRATIESTLWHLDPHSELAAHLRETTKEIRRHTLAGLLPKPKQKSQQQKSLPYLQEEEDESEEPELPRLSVPRQQSPAREPQKLLTNEGSRYQLRDRQDHVPIIELSSDVSSELSDEPIYDFDHAPDQGESASASDMSTLAKEHQKPSREIPVEEALTQEMPTHESKKRPAEDDGEDDASPVSKRVKGWLTHITGGYM
ncbi:hypothetical protein FBULB1_8272 [Fusarium bulbicola]|nr:hypothetical protein FBULB1_8272 [Fusarium bulbicola]